MKVALCLLAMVLTLAACADRDPAPDPLACPGCNLVIVSLTNVRRDHLGIYGYPRPVSRAIDNFFAPGIVFENAFAPASWTLPVSASLFSSLMPYRHGVMSRDTDNRLADDVVTLTELLRDAGYKTAAFTGGGDYNRAFNVNQGFQEYVDETNYHDLGLATASDANLMGYLGIERLSLLAVQYLKQHQRDRFFLFLQGYDAHCPFTPKPPYDKLFDPGYDGGQDFSDCLWTFGRTVPVAKDGVRVWPVKTTYHPGENRYREVFLSPRDVVQLIARYDGAIAQADSYLAGFLAAAEALGLTRNTIFVFISEHGDLFGEHGRFMRGGPVRGTFYEPVLHFPLLIRHPRIAGLVSVPARAQTIDILPTLVEMLHVADPQARERQGQSLVPAIRDPRRQVNDVVLAGSRYLACANVFFSGLSVSEAIQDEHWKLLREAIYDPDTGKRTDLSYELFDVTRDAAEETNLFYEHRDVADRLEAELRARLGPDPYSVRAPSCLP